jgi:cell division transport system ATP-binding protein
MIEFNHVCKAYDKGVQTINDLNLRIEDGEFVFIVGTSGSGKTTLIKLLLKETEASSGEIRVGDTNICRMKKRHIPKYRRRLGVVFQDFRLLHDRNVYDNVAFAQRVVGTPPREIRRRVPEVLSLVGLSAKYKSYPRQLSGGEQQRVAIARALVNRPEILLADEPTGNMDPENAWHIMELLEKINEMGTTVVVVTHSQEIVDRMKKRVVTMKRGSIVRDEERGGYLYED